MLETIRAFIAVNLEVNTIRRVSALQRSLRSSPEAPSTHVAWVAPPNIHITLRALGDIDRALAPAFGDALGDIVADCPPIRVQLGEVAAFPNQNHARLLIVNTREPSGVLEQLAEKIEQLTQSFGFPPETRPLHPHLTLGRMAQPVDMTRWFASLGRTDLADANVTECVLYTGEIDRPGAEFTALRRIAIGTPPAGPSHRPRARHPSQRPKPRSKPPTSCTRSASADAIPPPAKLPNLSQGEEGSEGQ